MAGIAAHVAEGAIAERRDEVRVVARGGGASASARADGFVVADLAVQVDRHELIEAAASGAHDELADPDRSASPFGFGGAKRS
jgi:hypothetical protein